MSPVASKNSLSLQFKLLGALTLGLAFVLLCALAGLASAWVSLSTEVPEQVQQATDSETMSREFRLQVQEWKNVLIRGNQPELLNKHLAAFNDKAATVAKLAEQLAKQMDDGQSAALAAQFGKEHQALTENYRAALTGFAAAQFDPHAGDELVRGMDRAPTQTLESLIKRAKQVADAAVISKSNDARATLVWSGVFALLAAVALVVALAWWIRRSVIAPVVSAALAAQAVAAGNLDYRIKVESRDEVGQLATAMQSMTAILKDVIAAQLDMAARHDSGQISYRIDDSRFPGEYGRMVRESNGLVAQHIGVKLRVVDVMRRYSVGDLSVDMDRLPGEKAVITEAMDATKANLAAINGEIKRLALAASAGDFSLRGDVQRYQYDFREMVAGLNGLMETTDTNLAEVSTLLQAIARGDLTVRMQGDFHGVFARMRDDANATVVQLTDIVGRIQEASSTINLAAGEIATGNEDLSQRTEQ